MKHLITFRTAVAAFMLCFAAITTQTMAQQFTFSYKGNSFTCNPVSHPELGSNLVEIHCTSGSGICEIPATVTNSSITYTVIGTKDNAPFSNSFTEVIIPNTVVYIGQQSFSGTSGATSLQKITFGENVKQISNMAFRWCTNLQEMRFKSDYRPRLVTYYDVSQPLLSDLRYAFGENIEGTWVRMVPTSCVIVVPVGKISEYATLDVCNGTVRKFGDYFTNIIEYVEPTLESLTVVLTAGDGQVTLSPQTPEAGYDFYYSDVTHYNMDIAVFEPTYGEPISDYTSMNIYSSAIDIFGANGTERKVVVYKVETAGNTIVGWGGASATPTETSGISEVLANAISIYPNPTKAELRIESGNLRVESVEIVDIAGKTLMSQMSSLSQINVANLPAGTYFVKLKTDKGELTKKVIKE